MSFKIIGTGSYVPEFTVTNDNLADMVETSDEWITQRVGVRERRISTCESAAQMGYEAAKRALEMANTSPEELDLIVAASISSDTVCPTVAGTVQSLLKASCPAFDVNSACSGFMFALDTAAGFFERKKVKKALVLGAERISKLIDWTDRNTCVIFGDGAGAAVLEVGEGYIDSQLFTEGGDGVIKIPSSAGSSPFYKKEAEAPHIFMNGQQTFKFAVNAMTQSVINLAERVGITPNDLKFIVPHQANIRIIQLASKRLDIPMERFFVNIDKYGNTSAASVPIALDELNRTGELKEGDLVALTAFGGGLSSACCIIKW